MDEKELQIAELERQIEVLRAGTDLEMNENIRRYALEDIVTSGVTSTATDITQAVDESGAGSYNVAKVPDLKVIFTIDGTDYYVGLYSI